MGGASSKTKKESKNAKETKNTTKNEKQEVEEPKKEEEFSNQAGGHQGAFLKGGEGQIMKRVGNNEFTFYKTTLHDYPSLKPFAPGYFGTQEKDDNKYIVIEDLTQYYVKPCILDVKIGTSSVGEDASPEKKASMEKKDKGTTTVSMGMRITAMKVYQAKTGNFVTYDKPWGKKVTPETMAESLKVFFDNGEEIRKDLIDGFLELLEKIQDWMKDQTDLRFYSSSLLFLYDGKKEDGKPSKVDIKMIDFAHVHEITDNGKDEGYIFGLKNLIETLELIKTN